MNIELISNSIDEFDNFIVGDYDNEFKPNPKNHIKIIIRECTYGEDWIVELFEETKFFKIHT